jgi:DNA-binding transcriptional ArsR family regulator
MAKIKVPKDMLEKETSKSLPAKDKEEYITNLLKKILSLNPDGVTLSEIKAATGIPPSTIWHHLEILKSTALSRKISRGNIDVYYSFGDLVHLDDYNKGKASYTLSRVENQDGKFVCIHEKREKSMGSQSVIRGIDIPISLIDDFVKTLLNVKKSLKSKK